MILRALLLEALKRAAMDPKMRARAGRVYREDLQPHLSEAARRGRGAAGGLGEDWQKVAEEIDARSEPGRFAGRLAGRLKRRLRSGEPE